MADSVLFRQGNTVTLTIPAASGISVYTQGKAVVYQVVSGANVPTSPEAVLATVVNGVPYASGAFASGANLTITNFGEYPVYYQIGVSPATLAQTNGGYQATPGTLNATGTLTAALIKGRIVTSSTAAAVVATLDTGTIMDASGVYAIGESFDWNVINTGGANAFTVTASAGHTIVGAGAVALSSSGDFRTTKTAANTFITYRIG